MTKKRSPALDTAMAYHQAWTGHDFDRRYTQMLWMGLRTKAAYLPG